MPDNRLYPKPNPKVVKGWKEKKYGSLVKLNSLVPFIKLYGVLDADELRLYNEIITENEDAAENAELRGEEPPRRFLPDGFTSSFNRALDLEFANVDDSKVTNINQIILNSDNGSLKVIDMDPLQTQSSYNNWNGGFGIKDMNSSRMTDTPLTENFSMSVQLNNPSLLRDRYEYNKLVTVGSFFIIMYGWSNNSANSLINVQEQKMTLDLSEEGTYNNGNWRWAIVQLHKFDWNFNSDGQMEGTLDFIAAQSTELIFNMGGRLSKLSQAALIFMNSRLLGGAPNAEVYIENLSIYNPNKPDPADLYNNSTLRAVLNSNPAVAGDADSANGGDDAPDLEEDYQKAAWEAFQAAKLGAFGPVRVMGDVKGGKNKIKRDDSKNYFDNKGSELPIGYWDISGDRRWAVLGDYFDGEWRPHPTFLAQKPDRQKELSATRWLNFFPLVIDENNKETDPFGNEFIKPIISRVKFEPIINPRTDNENVWGKNNKGDDWSVSKMSFPPEFRAEDSLATEQWEDKFIGRILYNNNEISIDDPEVNNIMKTLPEGVIITKRTQKPNVADSKFKISSEDIIYYYLGWIVEALKYYNRQFGGKDINIHHSSLSGTPFSENFVPSFIDNVNNTVNQIYSKSVEDGKNKAENWKSTFTPVLDYGSAFLNEGGKPSARLVKPEDVPARRPSDFVQWVPTTAGGNIQGLYWEEANILFPNIPSPDQLHAGDISNSLTVNGERVTFRNIIKSPENLQGDKDYFIPVGQAIPQLQRQTVSDSVQEGVNRVELSGTTAFEGGAITNTCQIPLDAGKVDELFEDSNGLQPADLLNRLLTDCVAIPSFSLMLVPESNGDLSIKPVGSQKTSPEVFNADYTESDLDYFKEGDNFILEYRTKNSLVQKLAVGSKMDPNISFLYGSSIRAINNKKDVLRYINQATQGNPDSKINIGTFSNYAKLWYSENRPGDSGLQTFMSKAGTFDSYDGRANALTEDEANFIETIPEDLFSSYLAQDYKLYKEIQIRSMNESNVINEMFTYYMNQLTCQIHGTTGLECMQFVQLRNVSSLIDGIYCIIGVTDSVKSDSFETELKLMLICPASRLNPPTNTAADQRVSETYAEPPVTQVFETPDGLDYDYQERTEEIIEDFQRTGLLPPADAVQGLYGDLDGDGDIDSDDERIFYEDLRNEERD